MASLKSLAKDSVIYGLSSIAGRFINYLLVPIQTAKFAASGGEYGVVTNIYAYTALLLVLLTFGMETTFFRFMGREDADSRRTYSTSMIMVGTVAAVFATLVLLFLGPISHAMQYADHPSFVGVMAVCVAIDAFQCIPFAYLRFNKRPIKFVVIRLLNIGLNILLNLLYLVILPYFKVNLFGIYDDNFTLDVGYVFYINLFCTVFTTFLLGKEITAVPWRFDSTLCRRMLRYAWPLLLLGIAGILNQAFDKMFFLNIYDGTDGRQQLGIYGAAVKIAMIMAMITQAFRYAYEPFVFGNSTDKNNPAMLAKAMKYFIIFTLIAFLAVMAWIDVLKRIIAPDYWVGLKVVPIVMTAEIMMGIYFNLSFWYKLIDKTIWGAWFSGIGCLVLIIINVLFVPRYGYMACAWAGVAGYGTAMVLSYLVGQRYNPINYPLREIALYTLLAVALLAVMMLTPIENVWIATTLRTIVLMLFVAVVAKHEGLAAAIQAKLRGRGK
ncbi:MAG: lipopolysaccharide biosynthesis protein [Muribaculaceae bacterium]|nr:lipopolysaccharide biosynthesis protein [Muribaculaceae bacterium]MBR3100369.1 lipopolysaccharide biosynthesis protein [Muribaculaceae bacterium]